MSLTSMSVLSLSVFSALVLLFAAPDVVLAQSSEPPSPTVDPQRLEAHGIRAIGGRHLKLYTDLPVTPEIAELPAVFDAAVPLWCEYFDTPDSVVQDWTMTAYLMRDKRRFEAAGALPDDLPPFRSGYQMNSEIWLYEQPSDYYRRHLLLHEGTHAFMMHRYRSAGPPWYREGIAEYFGTHAWRDGKLTIGVFPSSKDEFPYWGRILIIRKEVAAGRSLSLREVLNLGSDAHLRNEPYAWCWAATWFLQHHPLTRESFTQLKNHATDRRRDISARFVDRLAPAWADVNRQWRLFVADLDYGYDLSSEVLKGERSVELPEDGHRDVTIDARRGWQSAGIRLQAGRSCRIRAVGRYQVADRPTVWWCEPGGVTIRYHRGRPLGMLIGAIVDETDASPAENPFADAFSIGLNRTLRCDKSGTLYLRINESSSGLNDNDGELTVRVEGSASPK